MHLVVFGAVTCVHSHSLQSQSQFNPMTTYVGMITLFAGNFAPRGFVSSPMSLPATRRYRTDQAAMVELGLAIILRDPIGWMCVGRLRCTFRRGQVWPAPREHHIRPPFPENINGAQKKRQHGGGG